MAGISKRKRSKKENEMELNEDDDLNEELNEKSEEEMDDDDEGEAVNQIMQLEFEGRKPEGCHFNGIRRLLQQLFLKLPVNVSDLTNWIIERGYIGSVLQQIVPSEDEDEDEDDDDDNDVVMSVTTVVNITDRKDVEFVTQVKSLLVGKCKTSAPKRCSEFEQILNGADKQVGLLINERMLGLPPHATVFDSLWKDMEKANKKGMKYDFSFFLLISKTYRPIQTTKKKNKQNPGTDSERHFVNSEEEIFHRNSSLSFDFSVKDQHDTALRGDWEDEEESYEPMRTVVVVTADKISTIMSEMAVTTTSSN